MKKVIAFGVRHVCRFCRLQDVVMFINKVNGSAWHTGTNCLTLKTYY